MSDLIERLRDPKTEGACWCCQSAADEIERLTTENRELRVALAPFAACDPTLLNPAIDPTDQWLWKPQGRNITYGINVAHIIAAKELLDPTSSQKS